MVDPYRLALICIESRGFDGVPFWRYDSGWGYDSGTKNGGYTWAV